MLTKVSSDHILTDLTRSHTWICLQSWPLAGRVILLNVIGHFRDTLIAVCSTLSSVPPTADEHNEKFLLTANQSKWHKCQHLFYCSWNVTSTRNRFLNNNLKTCKCAGMICGTHFLWYSVQLVEGVYATSSVKQSWLKVYEPAEGRRGGTGKKKQNNSHSWRLLL